MKSKKGICIMNVNFAGNNYSDLGINKTDATKAKPDNRKYEPQKPNNKDLEKGLNALGVQGRASININSKPSFEERCKKAASMLRELDAKSAEARKAYIKYHTASVEEYRAIEEEFEAACTKLEQEDPEVFEFLLGVGLSYGTEINSEVGSIPGTSPTEEPN